ncbi:MAG TPA: hypothetical protein VIL00_15675 [Pseudonocardiaceae bacterium]
MWWRIIGGLLVVWLAVSVLGAVIKGLFWLAVVGAIAFAVTAVVGWARRSELPGKSGRDRLPR